MFSAGHAWEGGRIRTRWHTTRLMAGLMAGITVVSGRGDGRFRSIGVGR